MRFSDTVLWWFDLGLQAGLSSVETKIPIEEKALPTTLSDGSLKSHFVPNAAGYRMLAESIAGLLKKNGAVEQRIGITMEKMKSGKQDLKAMIPAVILPDGYRGKILLVLITRGECSMMALRSGDLWHREILRNTRAEMIRIGLMDVQVEQMGGAFLRFEADGSIRIWGSSDEFGACDLDYAATLVKAARPGCKVIVSKGDVA